MKFLLLTAVTLTPFFANDLEPGQRLDHAAALFADVISAPGKGISPDLIERAFCIIIVPDGKGYLFCRNNAGPGWSAPGAVDVQAGKLRSQIGSPSTDLVMLVMSRRRADQLLARKFTLGAEASVAAGPVGATAGETEAQIHADILSWTLSKGSLTGKALDAVTLWQDVDENAALYGGNKLENRDIVTEGVLPPKPASKILDLLNQYSFRE